MTAPHVPAREHARYSALAIPLLIGGLLASHGCVEVQPEEVQEASPISTLAVPNPPASLELLIRDCNGAYVAFWSTSEGAAGYQLWRSNSMSFTNPVLIYSGALTTWEFTVPLGGRWYVRAKACSAEGCSGYTGQREAKYYSGCP